MKKEVFIYLQFRAEAAVSQVNKLKSQVAELTKQRDEAREAYTAMFARGFQFALTLRSLIIMVVRWRYKTRSPFLLSIFGPFLGEGQGCWRAL